MSIKFFGQYLLENNSISAEKLLEAVRYQESHNLRFGEYAESKGYLTKADIARILHEQKSTDMQFGQLAVQMGILSEDQVKEILLRQKNDHIMIGEAIIVKGFLTKERLEAELASFQADQRRYDLGEVQLPEGVADPDIMKSFCDITVKMLPRVSSITAKANPGVYISTEPAADYLCVRTGMSGDLPYDYVLLTSRGVALELASGIIGSDISAEPDDIIVDGVKEFCNIVCGNMMAVMAKKGKSVALGIPDVLHHSDRGYGILNGKKAVSFVIGSTAGELALIIV